jgi:hypothetical protein
MEARDEPHHSINVKRDLNPDHAAADRQKRAAHVINWAGSLSPVLFY